MPRNACVRRRDRQLQGPQLGRHLRGAERRPGRALRGRGSLAAQEHAEHERSTADDDDEGDTIYERFVRNTSPYPFVTPMRMTSLEAAREFEDDSVDWVFIDGLHTFGAVRADIRAWGRRIKPGGVVSGHDHSWRSVRLAVASHFPAVEVCDTIWHLRKQHDELPVRALALASAAHEHGRTGNGAPPAAPRRVGSPECALPRWPALPCWRSSSRPPEPPCCTPRPCCRPARAASCRSRASPTGPARRTSTTSRRCSPRSSGRPRCSASPARRRRRRPA